MPTLEIFLNSVRWGVRLDLSVLLNMFNVAVFSLYTQIHVDVSWFEYPSDSGSITIINLL